METLYSKEDASVNFVKRTPDGGAFESRYVRREEDYFICYLSSHTGCNKACRFCHLTQTKQTTMKPASIDEYAEQANLVFKHYHQLGNPAKRVNFNFMARGEPLANEVIYKTRPWFSLKSYLRNIAIIYGVHEQKFNISTIMPHEMEHRKLHKIIGHEKDTQLYYSLYSLDPEFRKRWLPKAMDPAKALDKLAEYQVITGNEIALHWSFIEDQNDDFGTLDEIVDAVTSRGLNVKFNLVRYNPYSPAQGCEPSEEVLQEAFDYLNKAFQNPNSRIVPRVGFDVKASCGMFVS